MSKLRRVVIKEPAKKHKGFVACPECGSNNVRTGIYAGGCTSEHWEEDRCEDCGCYFNERLVSHILRWD